MIISFKVTEMHDPTYAFADLVLWSYVYFHQTRRILKLTTPSRHAEVNAGVICASLPTLRPFVRRFSPSVLPTTSTDDSSATKGVVVLDERGHMTRYELKSFRRIQGEQKVDRVEQ